MRRRAELSLSFSMILSLIIIAAVIGVGFYMVSYFLSLKNCTELGLYKRDLQLRIDDAWSSEEVSEVFSGTLPSSVDRICIGSLQAGRNSPEYAVLQRFDDPEANLFYYPLPSGRCEVTYGSLDHARFTGFTCIDVIKNKASVRLVKGSFDSTVLVCDPADSDCRL